MLYPYRHPDNASFRCPASLYSLLAPLGVILLCLLFTPVSYADNHSTNGAAKPDRKKIGLVLSGGGARGAAHVGVIKVLEELNIPVDYIVGTSLGSVVGALYSMGQTPAQMEFTLATLEWNRGFVDNLPRSQLPFRRKDEEDKFQTNFELGVEGFSVSLPPGVIQGHGLYLLLQTLVGGSALQRDFDKLPIPYLAIATDLEKSKTVVLDSGDLAKSLQASMSIPAIFAPVEIDGRLLVDGGVTNNLAVDVVREMGADIVIAVDISTPLSTRSQLGSLPQILNQLTNILTHNGTDRQIATLEGSDILLSPELKNFSAVDFNSVNDISFIGETYARENAAKLEGLSLSDSEYAEYKNELKKTEVKKLPKRIGKVVLNQDSDVSDERFRLRARLRDNSEYSTDKLHTSINSIYSSDLFDTIDYTFIPDPNDETTADLEINTHRRSWGTDRVQFGFVLEDDFTGDNNFLISAGYTRRSINRLGGDVRLVGRVGELPGALLEYFQPLDRKGNYFTLAQLDNEQFSTGLFNNDSELETFRVTRNQAALFVGWQNANNLEFRLGVTTGSGVIRQRVGVGESSKISSFREGIFQLRARYDTVNSKTFPASGQKVKVTYEVGVDAFNSDTNFQSLVVDALIAREFGKFRWIAAAEISESIDGTVPQQRQFARGSILSTAGLRADTELGDNAARFSLLAYRPLRTSRVEALENPIYFGAALELGRVSQAPGNVGDEDPSFSGSVFVAVDTPAGPLFLGAGAKEGTGVIGLLSLGLTF